MVARILELFIVAFLNKESLWFHILTELKDNSPPNELLIFRTVLY